MQAEVVRIDGSFDAATEPLDESTVKPRATDVVVRLLALVWAPVWVSEGKGLDAW